MSEDADIESLPEFQQHMAALEERYQNGGLDFERGVLEDCIEAHGEEIRAFATKSGIDREKAAIVWMMMKRHLSSKLELAEQGNEVMRYQHHLEETGEHRSFNEAAYDWSDRYAKEWRDFSVTAAAFVFHKEKAYFMRLLWLDG